MSDPRTRRSILADNRTPVNYNRPHYVYRGFDGYGLLLYIGCTVNPDGRLATHRSGSLWYRFSESIGVFGPYERDEALRIERQAIDSEGPHFNSSFANMRLVQANKVAARRNLIARHDREPDFEGSREELVEGNPRWEAYSDAHEAWLRRLEAEQLRLKAGPYPFMTDEDRLARYLAARETAALAAARDAERVA